MSHKYYSDTLRRNFKKNLKQGNTLVGNSNWVTTLVYHGVYLNVTNLERFGKNVRRHIWRQLNRAIRAFEVEADSHKIFDLGFSTGPIIPVKAGKPFLIV